MQSIEQFNVFKLLTNALLAVFTMGFLFSCSKNNVDLPSADKAQAISENAADPEQGNSLVNVPFQTTVYVPCANGGTGEKIALDGYSSFVYQINWNDNGFGMSYHVNSYNIAGLGLTSGETFVGSQGSQGTVRGSFVDRQWEGTTIQQTRIIGNNTSFFITYTYHITVTADGNVTVLLRDRTVECN